jgi:pyruvate dehydrogenase complex dehydrogenase (E1) component
MIALLQIPHYSALTFQGATAWRRRLLDDLGDQGPLSQLIERRSDDELARLMANLGGHDLPRCSRRSIRQACMTDRPASSPTRSRGLGCHLQVTRTTMPG